MALVVRGFALLLLVVPLLAPAATAEILFDPAMVPPSPPMNVEVSPGSADVTITWDAPLFFGGADEVTYRVYRDSSLIAEGLNTMSYIDALPVGDSATASYSVTAVNDAGESAPMNGTCIDTEGPAVDPEICIGIVMDTAWWAIDQIPII